MSEGIEQIVEQRGHWRKVIEMGHVIPDLVCHECILCGFTITSAPRDRHDLEAMCRETERVLREIEDHDHSDHPDKFEPMSFADFVQALDTRAMDINFHFALDAFKWPDRCWGKITHAGRKSLREHGEVSQ
jgi:hypothetical protein